MAISTATASRPPKLVFGEIFSFAYDTFCSNKVRFSLTALGMVIGTASLILVVTIGMTGKQYVLNQIQSIGANMIDAEYQGGEQRGTTPDRWFRLASRPLAPQPLLQHFALGGSKPGNPLLVGT